MIKLQNILNKLHVRPHISMAFCTISGSFKIHAIVHVHCTSATCTMCNSSWVLESQMTNKIHIPKDLQCYMYMYIMFKFILNTVDVPKYQKALDTENKYFVEQLQALFWFTLYSRILYFLKC